MEFKLFLKCIVAITTVIVLGGGVWYFLRDSRKKTNDMPSDLVCSSLLSSGLRLEISDYKDKVNQILDYGVAGKFRHNVWEELANFVDKFGNRFVGSTNLEDSITYVNNLLKYYELENVHGENVTVPQWVRGKESAFLTSPRVQQLNILGLGYSVGTPKEGISADVLVVQSFEELHVRASEANDKIVVIAEDWLGSYGATVKYRSRAAVEVAKVGGVAALIRSITQFSINSPHTGMMSYEEGVKKIPVAALTVENAEMLLRMSKRGVPLKIILFMDAKMQPNTVSRNTVAELKGTKEPEKVVVVSGHLDSWDVGQGAMDDGGGAFISWGALALLKSLGLRPKRTIRAVLWTAEEMGLIGAQAYSEAHINETDNFIAMMESDEGTFTPLGLEYGGSDEGGCIIKEILKLMAPLNATQFKNSSDVGSDITVWTNRVPLLSNLNDNGRYFWFHHTEGDTMTVMNPDDLDKNLALWAATAYILADLSIDLPKPNSTPSEI